MVAQAGVSLFFILPTSNSGGANQTRTDDPLLAKQVLYQLSYDPRTLHHSFVKAHTFYTFIYIKSNKKIYLLDN